MPKIVITGGPCAGKTTLLAMANERLRSLGRRVLVCPEAATMAIMGGLRPWEMGDAAYFDFQQELLRMQMSHEAFFTRNADPETIILFDRGTMDNSAFCKDGQWSALMDEMSYNVSMLRDQRYDGIIHLTTAAIGAEHAYTLENNAARTETPEQAAEIDRKIMSAWVGHPHLKVIDNSGGDFGRKMTRAVSAICELVGHPHPVEYERKFVIDVRPGEVESVLVRNGVVWTKIDIEQTYLDGGDKESRIRRWSQNGSSVYFHTLKSPGPKNGRIEKERQITPREYWTLRQDSRDSIRKSRYTFVHGNNYCELDVYLDPALERPTLEIEGEEMSDPPAFIPILKEVTGVKEWSNASIARSNGYGFRD